MGNVIPPSARARGADDADHEGTARGLCSPSRGATTRYHTPGFRGHRTRQVIVGCIGCRQRHQR
jgi:hypothetical protein